MPVEVVLFGVIAWIALANLAVACCIAAGRADRRDAAARARARRPVAPRRSCRVVAVEGVRVG